MEPQAEPATEPSPESSPVQGQAELDGTQSEEDRNPLPTDSMVTVPLSAGWASCDEDAGQRRESTVSEEWLNRENEESTDAAVPHEDGSLSKEDSSARFSEVSRISREWINCKEKESMELQQEKKSSAGEDAVLETFRESLDCGNRDSTTAIVEQEEDNGSKSDSVVRSRSSSCTSRKSTNGSQEPDSDNVDWVELEKTEELESKADPDDESTALLLARLEQENNALAIDPKSGLSSDTQPRPMSRPPSVQQLKKLVDEPARSSVRLSQLPAPQMTELEFWAALVADYPRTAQKLPTLTSNKMRGGVPPPLRGVVWPSIAGARDTGLQEEYDRLCGETSPYEGLIGKDIGRSWPNVEMFKDPNGEGQQMLARVLKCFSLHDSKIGYCQGLGFVVGPLLMHMNEAEAFCVLVRLMDHYDLRSCFLPTMSGLHLRTFQFQTLLSRHLPNLHAHLEELKIEPVYVSQWFLSFFAVTCPLPMLLRIYDVLLLEGACETLMRVALSLMQRNEEKLLACQEFEDVMQLLLSRTLWDTYSCNADDLVTDFVSLTSLVTRESLQALETAYKETQETSQGTQFPQMQAVASRFLGRLWAGSSSNSTKSLVLGPTPSRTPSSVSGTVRRTPSKQSMASTLNSLESSNSDASTIATEVSSAESSRRKPKQQNKDNNLHGQIEDLLMALTDMQREQAALAKELQREREEREEDQKLASLMVEYIKELPADEQNEELLSKVTSRFSSRDSKRVSSMQTKQQLYEDVATWKEKYEVEAARCQGLGRSIDEHEQEKAQLKEELREARGRIQESHYEKQRLKRTIQGLRSRNSSGRPDSKTESARSSSSSTGLREFKLGKASTAPAAATTTTTPPTFSKRSSSLDPSTVISTEAYQEADEEGLLVELVNAKTAEATARQELDEVKAKLETLRKLVSNTGSISSTPASPALDGAANITITPPANSSSTTSPSSALSSAGTFFSSWTKRATPDTK